MIGDALLAGSLVGSLFFSGTTSGARDKVLLALVLTLLPFAIVTPLLGPALDRVQGGRRLIAVLCCVGRCLLCLVMSRYVTKPSPEGLLIYPLAFGALVFGKGYAISRSALVPTVVKDPDELVRANSRLAIISNVFAPVGVLPRRRDPEGLRRRLVAPARRGRLRGGDRPGVQAAEVRGQVGPPEPAPRTRGAPPAERPARGQCDGRPARRGRIQCVLRRVRVPRRQVRARTHRDLRRGGRTLRQHHRAHAPGLRARRGDALRRVAGFGHRDRHRRAPRGVLRVRPGRAVDRDRVRYGEAGVRQPPPARRTRRRPRARRSRCSRRASRSSGCSARSSA